MSPVRAVRMIFAAGLSGALCLGLVGRVFADLRGEATPTTASAPPAKPFLWSIQREGTATSYLFGTIHLPRPEVTNYGTAVREALAATDAVYTEIPLNPSTLLKMAGAFLLPDGQKISEILPPDLYAEAKAEVDAIAPGSDPSTRERMRIWAFTVSLATLQDEKTATSGLPLDMIIYQYGALRGKKTGGLETPEEQIAIFEALSMDDQIALLRSTVAQLREARLKGVSVTDDLIAAYVSGDLDRIQDVVESSQDLSNDEIGKRLLTKVLDDRNVLMSERITALLEANPSTSYFFAVGAGHFYGPGGLIARLEKSGFTLTRISDSNN